MHDNRGDVREAARDNARAPRSAIPGRSKEVVFLMPKQRKDTTRRARRPFKPTEVAVILAALGTLLSGLAALLTALHK